MNLAAWLESLGLGEYAARFAEEAIDAEVLKGLGEADLERLGVARMGHRRKLLVAIAGIQAGSDDGLGALAAEWPFVVAAPLRAYREEMHPVMRLWAMCDTLELLLRFLVAIGVAELRALGALDQRVVAVMKERLNAPTLSPWLEMTKALTAAGTARWQIAPEAGAYVRDALVPLLNGNEPRQTAESALLALRNLALAHGTPLTRREGDRLVAIWRDRFEATVRAAAWLRAVHIVARTAEGDWIALRGGEGEAVPTDAPTAAAYPDDGVWAVRDGAARLLRPLTLFRPPQYGERPPGTRPATHVYARRGTVRLQYTPLGVEGWIESDGDESGLAEFLELFRLADATPAGSGRFTDFEKEVRRDAQQAIGREAEVDALRGAIEATFEGYIWVPGVAGGGKSFVMALLATALLDDPLPRTLILPYRFRSGDMQRCSREAFLGFAVERLDLWDGLVPVDPKSPVSETLPTIERLRQRIARIATDRRVVFLLDGLDEIGLREPRFTAEVVFNLGATRVLWVGAGRPDLGLDEQFRAARSVMPFPNGLPRLGQDAIRGMLLERAPLLRRKLLANDREQDGIVLNPFIELVTARADGLPLYVSYVIGDVAEGRYRALDGEEPLPKGLDAYHEELIRRLGIGDLQQVVTPLAATLAVAEEPLAEATLAALFQYRSLVTADGLGRTLVGKGLSAIASIVRCMPTPEGEDGYLLHHTTLALHIRESSQMQVSVATARDAFATAGRDPATLPGARGYLYRNGVTHLLQAGRAREARSLLANFNYLMERLIALSAADPTPVAGITADWRAVVKTLGRGERHARRAEAFWCERAHMFRRGNIDWPSYKILLQAAVEHGDDSPMSRRADEWVERRCHWPWLRAIGRPAHVRESSCVAILEGHSRSVEGALVMPDGRVLSWSTDNTLRLWDSVTGAPGPVLKDTASIRGALVMPDGRVLSWSTDNTLRLWDSVTGAPGPVLKGHTASITGALVMPDGRILSWSTDNTLRLWDSVTGAPGPVLKDTASIRGALVMPDGRVLSWSTDNTLRLWDSVTGAPGPVLKGHTASITGALVMPDGRVLSWSGDNTLRLWDSVTGAPGPVLKGHTASITGALVMSDGRILSWSSAWPPDLTLRLWDGATGVPGPVLKGHTWSVKGALVMPDGRVLSWSGDNTLRLWDSVTGAPGPVLKGHTASITGALVMPDGRILSWSHDGTLRVWDGATGAPGPVLKGHNSPIEGALVIPDGRILSWATDSTGSGDLKTLRIWNAKLGAANPAPYVQTRRRGVVGVLAMPDGRILSWSHDGTLRLWDGATGAPGLVIEVDDDDGDRWAIDGAIVLRGGWILCWCWNALLQQNAETGAPGPVLKGHTDKVIGALEMPDGRILSWSNDKTLRLWDPITGEAGPILEGHTDRVWGALVMPDGRILSWSRDHTLRLWDGATGAPGPVLEGYTNEVTGALVTPDGRILTWTCDNALRLWDAITLAPVLDARTVSWFGKLDLGSVVALPEGRTLSNGALRVWRPRGRFIENSAKCPDHVIAWHGSVGTKVAHIDRSGRVIITTDDGYVVPVFLYVGAKHTSFPDLT